MRKALLCASLCLSGIGLKAQYPDTRTFELRVSQQRPHITCLAQDNLGLIWAGSDMGVMRSDGERTEMVFRTEGIATTSIVASGSVVYAALADGRVIACDGLSTRELLRDTAIAQHNGRSLFRASGNTLWIGLYGGGIKIFSLATQRVIASVQDLPDEHVHAIAALENGNIAIATDLGIAICDSTGIVQRTISESEGLADNLVTALTSDNAGGLWVGTDRSGVIHMSRNGSLASLLPQWPHGPVGTLALTDSMIFVGTADHGVVALAIGKGIATYLPPQVLAKGSRPQHLMRCADGAIWWCDGTDILYRSDATALIAPEHEGVDLTHITALCSDGADRIWFATQHGLFMHKASYPDAEKLTRIELPLEGSAPIICLHADPAGGLWAGTLGKGVFHFPPHGGAARHFTVTDGLSNDNVLSIRSVSDGTGPQVWFATLGGACVFTYGAVGNGGAFKTMELPGNGFLYDVLPVRKDEAFLGTDGNGIIHVMPDTATVVLLPEGPKTFYSMCAGGDGTVWACGPGTGLCRVDPQGLHGHGNNVPPFDGNVYGIIPYAGHIVAIGESGLAAFDLAKNKIIDLGHEYGLEGVQSELNAVCADGSGALWLATDRGLLRLRPTEEVIDARVPTVITTLRWGDEILSLEGIPELRHDQNFITIQFTGLRFAAPEHIRFEYRLVGYDRDVRTTRDREVTWSRLPPGEYRFDVRAALGNNPMPGTWTSLAFTILQPWWLQWWAVMLWVLLLATVVMIFLRVRDDRLRYRDRMEKEKVRFQLEALRSQVNPHFLFNSFNTLIGLIEEDKDKAVEHTEQLSDFFRNILQVRDKDLIPLREELPLLETYFKLEKGRFGERIDLRITIPPTELDRFIPPLTLQLLVENAIKHNTATTDRPLLVEVIAENGTLRVRNPYRPRTTSAAGTGYGLESIRQRYQMLTDSPIQLEVTSETFEVRIPLITTQP